MKDLAPEIVRQRLLIEGHFTTEVNADAVEAYLLGLAAPLDLRTYSDPVIHSPDGEGSEENTGFDAFVPLIDSGISLSVWTNARFFAAVLLPANTLMKQRRFSSRAKISAQRTWTGLPFSCHRYGTT